MENAAFTLATKKSVKGNGLAVLFITIVLAVLTACGGGSSTSGNSAQPSLQSIQVSAASPTLSVAGSTQLTATGKYSDGSSKDLTQSATWSSSNPAVATVAGGLVTGLAQGKVTIQASFGSATPGTLVVNVNPPTLVSIAIGPTYSSIAPGTIAKFTATGTYSDGSTNDVTGIVTWSSSAAAVATISNAISTHGWAKGIAQGQSTITATSASVQASAVLNVTNATISSVAINPANPNIPLGTNQVFAALGTFSDNTIQDITNTTTWTTSNNTIASITVSGVATARKAGAATITATFGSVTQSTTLTVNLTNLTSISIQPGNLTLAQNTSQTFAAIGSFTDGGTRNITTLVTWTSSNAGVASFSKNGGFTATALSPGQTTIAASLTLTGGAVITGSITLTVTNASIVSISVTPTNSDIAAGTQQAFTATGAFSDNSTQVIMNDVAWSSANSGVATISDTAGSKGIATGVTTGTSKISASFDGVLGSAPLTVNSATLVSIALTPATSTLAPASTSQYSAIGTYSDNTTLNLNRLAQWSSSDPSAATITAFGSATGQAAGTTTITVQMGAVSATADLVVASASLDSISVTPLTASVPVQINTQFTAVGKFHDGSTQDLTQSVTWTSTPVTNATVSNVGGTKGQATGVAVGNATIMALFAGQSGAASLSVTNATLQSIIISPANPTIGTGSSEPFTAVGKFSDNTTVTLTDQVSWSSSNIGVAVINNFGVANAAGTGTTTITATLNGVTATTNLTVQ
ncbi:MAG: LigC protein [Acidobacteriaceae bacterium]|nr:LigC protein [Acidobacteriaceae bacterium]